MIFCHIHPSPLFLIYHLSTPISKNMSFNSIFGEDRRTALSSLFSCPEFWSLNHYNLANRCLSHGKYDNKWDFVKGFRMADYTKQLTWALDIHKIFSKNSL